MVHVVVIVGLVVMAASCVWHGKKSDQTPSGRRLPDPFRMEDGTRVKTAADWRARREEIQDMLLRIQYGRMPPPPGNVAVECELPGELMNDGRTTHRQVMLRFGPQHSLAMKVDLYVPAQGTGPFPAVVRVGLDAKPSKQINERGYLYACYDQHALDPDPKEGNDIVGPAQTAYPTYDWGSLAVWAWGASRTLDYLITRSNVNEHQVVVTGHSRGGKAALLAGAIDERFAMVVPSGSGCGGAGCYRIHGPNSETLKLITSPKRFKSWFQPNFGEYADKERELPFDQHFLKALVAPRLLLSTDALDDLWANPLGTQATYLAAQPVFQLLHAEKNNALHFRVGGHDQLPEDFSALLDFADLHFRAVPTSRPFHLLPFPKDARSL